MCRYFGGKEKVKSFFVVKIKKRDNAQRKYKTQNSVLYCFNNRNGEISEHALCACSVFTQKKNIP